MSRLVDPTICPDCRTPLAAGGACPTCGLVLQGPLAARLWQTMQAADVLIAQLRMQAAPAAVVLPPTATAGPGSTAAAPRRRGVSTLSVPVVLLSLGALCLLVAAVVFIAVTWSSLGLTGRTLVLVGFTALLAAVAVVLTRKDLRGAAETFWVIVGGMLVMDLLGGREAGLMGLDALEWRGTAALVGGALLALGVLVGWWGTGQPVRRLYGVQVVGVLGATVLTATNGWAAERPAVGTTVALPALLLLAAALRARVPVVAVGAVVLALTSWVVLLGIGTGRAAESAAFDSWWGDLRGWPLLAAAIAAAAVALLPTRRLDRAAWSRSLFAGMALLPLVVLANAPRSEDADRTVLVAGLTLVALAAVTQLSPPVWARAAGFLATVGGLGMGSGLLVLTLGLVLASRPLAPAALGDHLAVDSGFPLSGWVPPVMAAALAAALAALVRLAVAANLPGIRAWRVVGVLVCGVLGAGLADAVAALEPPLWAGLAVLGAGLAATTTLTWLLRRDPVAAAVGTLIAVGQAALGLGLAAPSDLAAALVLSLLAVTSAALFAVRDAEHGDISVLLAGSTSALLGGAALDRWGLVMGADDEARALALAVLAVVVGAIARPASRRTTGRVGLEVSAVLLGLAAVAGGPDSALATNLTVVGSGVCLVAVLFRDRNAFGWLGAAVLALATAVRVVDHVTAPEAYTLPAAALLLAVGLWRLGREPQARSIALLGSGLSLAVVPSLLLALDDPVSTRGALVAAGGLVALGVGGWCRLLAPFLFGAVTTALLALRHLEPVAEAVPRWVTLGLVGAVLLAVGVTWEARLRNLQTARRYLTTLR